MSFQAPFNPLALREMNMQEQQQRYNQDVSAVNSITGALAQLGGMTLEMEQKKQEDQAAYGALQAIGQMFPAFGKTVKALDQLDEGTRYMAARSVLGNIGAISQLGIAGMNQQMRAAQPYVAAGIKNQQNIAGGNVPHGSGMPQSPAGMAPVEPDLPVADEPLPPVAGAPAAVPGMSIPGGQSSIDAINRDRQRRGLPPIK